MAMLAVAAIAANAYGGEIAEAFGDDAFVFLSIPSVPELRSQGESAFDRIMAEPAMQRFINDGFTALDVMSDDFRSAAGMTFSEAADLALGAAALAVIPDETALAAAVAVVEVDSRSERLNSLLEKLSGLTDWEVTETPSGIVFSTRAEELEMAWALTDRYMVFSTSAAAAARMLEGLLSGPADSIADDSRYRRCLDLAEAQESELTAYLDVKRTLGAVLQHAPPEMSASLDALGLLNMGGIMYASRRAADGFADTLVMHFPDGRKGAFAAPEPLPGGAEAVLHRVPRRVLSASWAHSDISVTYEALTKAFEAAGALGVDADIAAHIEQLEAEMDVDVRRDLVDSLGKMILSYTPAPAQLFGPALSGGFGGGIMIADLESPEIFEESLGKLWAYLRQRQDDLEISFDEGPFAAEPVRFTFLEQDILGRTVYQVRVALMPMLQLTGAVAVAEGRLLAAMDTQSIRNALTTDISDADSLLENPDYIRGARLAGTAEVAGAYLDTKTTFENSYPMIRMMMPLLLSQAFETMPLEPMLLPESRVISQHLFGTVRAERAGDDYLMATAFSPTGQLRAGFAGGVVGGALGYWVAREGYLTILFQTGAAPSGP